MELKKVNIQNKGMSQDYSISKDNQEYAFKNKNVRIQALDDGTLLSITNIKGPKKIPVDISIEGTVVGKCFTGNYLVLFTCLSRSIQNNPSLGTERDKTLNYIYRIDLRRINNIKVNLLYSGYLGFELDRTFDTTFYYENANIQKVYWVESWYSEEQLKELRKKYPNNVYQNNGPRVINIITEGERIGEGFTEYTDNVFEFYPEVGEIPQFKILKDRSIPSQHPSGIIQYFISYYLDNGAETLIANNSSTFTIDHMNKGAKADETGACGFKITIKNVNTKFDYFRIYSAIRTSKDGPLLVKIVGDTKINKSNPDAQYTILDTGINQEIISDTQLFFIGGTPLYANTIEQKNDTVFLGNIKTPTAFIPNELRNIIDNRKIYYYEIKTKAGKKIVPFKYDENSPTKYITTLQSYKDIHGKEPDGFEYNEQDYSKNYHDGLFFSKCVINPKQFNITVGNSDRLYQVDTDDIYFTIKGDGRNLSNKYYKGLTTQNSMFSSYYNYRLQTGNSSKRYKTFKGGEMYRFGIQFQNKLGQWTDVIWLGDKECETYPIVDNENYQIHLNNAVYQIPEQVKQSCRNLGFDNYRIVIANPENQNGRRVQAQGVVCPTLFSPGQRALGNAYSISSWIMRPRGMACSHHHFEPIASSFANKGGEIFGIDIGKFDPVERVTKIPTDYPGIKYNEDGTEKYRSTHGGKLYTSPYYLTSTESQEIYDTSDAPKYLVIQMSVHSGHKIAFKATPVASEYMSTCLWNDGKNKYEYIKDDENILTYEVNYGVGGWGKIQEELTEKFISRGWDPYIIPSEKVFRKLGARQFWGEFLTILTLVTAIIAVGALTLLTGGLAAIIIGLILAIVSGSVAVAAGVTAGSAQNAWTNVVGKLKYDWQKELFYKGFIQMDTDYKNRQSQNCIIFGNGSGFLPKELASAGLNLDRPNAEVDEWEADGDNTASAIHFLNIIPLSGRRYDALEAESEFSKFYVDESIVTFHSPDIENCRDKNLQFRIVGTAPINSLYSNLDIQTSTPPLLPNGGLDNYRFSNYKKIQSDGQEISSILSGDYFYWDSQINNTGPAGGSIDYFLPSVGTLYKIFLWDKSGTITGGKDSMPLGNSKGNPIGPQLPSIIKSKTILNQLNSFGNHYFKLKDCVSYQYPSIIKVCNETDYANFINNKNKILIYKNNYDHLITYKRALTTHIEYGENYDILEGGSVVVAGPSVAHTVRIKYNSSEHGVFDLYSLQESKKFLLPCVEGEVPYKVGNVNYKNEEDHLWHEGGNGRIRAVDTCWTHSSEWYVDDVYFKIVPVKNNISWLQDHVKEVLENEFTLTDILMSKLYLSNKKPVHLGFVCFDINTSMGSDFEDLSISFIQELLKGKQKHSGKQTFTVNGKIYSGYVNYFKYILKDIQTDENGYIKEVKGYFTTRHNDYIYCTGGDIAKGRFKWVTNGDSGDGLHPYIDFPIKYEQPKIDASLVPNSKYLFVGELFYDLKPNQLYGGFNNIENLLWYPVSKITPIDKDVHETEGDTYYQRWDCLKTYPTTTEDETNKVVDITSFMVESHKNLDGRTDPNRDLYNIMSRPENFNLFNPVYDTVPNIFQYSTLRKTPTTEYKNQVVWSLKKNFDAKIDSWTNVNLASVANAKNSITKIKNFNNSLLLLSDYSIDRINYDEKNFVATDTEYIELANSSKVNGIIQMFSTFGTHNQSTLITEKGFYFIDDNEKSIIRISVDGSINKLAAGKMDSWFKNNVVEGTFTNENKEALHLEYDPIHKDIYIINNKDCLIYNENLEAFTSFVDYQDCYTLFNCSGSLLALSYNTPEIYEMFEGQYNTTFNNVPIDYSVQYRVNPSPYTDKVFTNVEFIADCSNVDNTLKVGYTPFDTIQAWNEYQDTLVKPLVFERNRPSNLKQKFRIWRADIPRDANSNWGRDRIRNPWINMTLSKKTNGDNYKLELHSMNVQYME